MATDTVSDALSEVSLFQDIAPDELQVLSHQVVRKEFSRNELIFSQEDRGDGLYIVASGHVSITRQNPNGDETHPCDVRAR